MNMKEKTLASPPQQARKWGRSKDRENCPQKGIFQSPQTSRKMNSDNVKLFGEVWNMQRVMDNSGIVPKNGFTSRFWEKNRSL